MSSTADPAPQRVRHAGRAVEDSAQEVGSSLPIRIGARIGIASNGVLHLLIAWLAVQVALGGRERADQNGAMQAIAAQPFGQALLWVIVVGFVAVVLWRIAAAIWGFGYVTDRRKRLMKRLVNAGQAVLFAALAALAARVAVGVSSGGGGGGEKPTGGLLALPGGPVIVGVIALGIAVTGVGMIYQGWRKNFTEDMCLRRAQPRARRVAELTGQIGYIAKGIALVILGVLVGVAAITYNPQQAIGLDGALKALAAQPFGPLLLIAIAAGLACFGIFCFFDARYHRV